MFSKKSMRSGDLIITKDGFSGRIVRKLAKGMILSGVKNRKIIMSDIKDWFSVRQSV